MFGYISKQHEQLANLLGFDASICFASFCALGNGRVQPKKKLKELISLREEWEVARTECDALGKATTNCEHG